jgi:hypothetical protein
MLRFIIYPRRQQHRHIKAWELGRTCSMHGRDKKPIHNFGKKNMKISVLKNLDVDGRIIFKLNFKEYDMRV